MDKKVVPLTDEQKKKFEPMLWQTWSAIAPDAEELISKRGRCGQIIELVVDAGRPVMFAKMTKEDWQLLSSAYSHPDTQRWLRSIFKNA